MIISIKHRFLFVHIAKTGGTSIRAALSRHRWKEPWFWGSFICSRISHLSGHSLGCKIPRHAKAVAAYEMLPRDFYNSLFKFTFVRNPWDRVVSRYHHNLREYPELMKDFQDFDTFARWTLDVDRKLPTHFRLANQSDFVVDLHGNVILDFIGRFENLQDDFRHICKTIGLPAPDLPHKRKSAARDSYRKYYTDETAELVARRYRSDIETFGYSFD